MNRELRILLVFVVVFVGFSFLPVDAPRFQGAILEAFRLSKWYAREHVLLCLLPAFFIAGAIGVFVSRNAVMKYFGPKAHKALAYGVASMSGAILAVCSCTVLPLFGGIYLRGAGLGPAIAFLYSGPAINVLAIVLTARVLGWQLGVARAVGAVAFSVIIGLLMHLIFLKEERAKAAQVQDVYVGGDDGRDRPLWQVALYFLSMVGILVFANWARPPESSGIWFAVFRAKWVLVALSALLLGVCVSRFRRQELTDWRDQTWSFAKQILPLLLVGVLAAGFFLGSPDGKDAGIIPNAWVQALVGPTPEALFPMIGKDHPLVFQSLETIWPLWTNLFASAAGALMYFATLTEVPILRGLLDSGMGQGPALALLLAGPALSLPNMLVIHSILGPKKTLTFIGLVVVMATATGMVFGAIVK